MSFRLLWVTLARASPLPAHAQDQAVQRELMRRQQQSESFTQQLHQSQQLLNVPAGDLVRRRELESKQFSERQRFEQTSEQQLRDVRPDLPQGLRPYERLKAEEERRPLMVPVE
jgi:multidrug resistance efflux pump